MFQKKLALLPCCCVRVEFVVYRQIFLKKLNLHLKNPRLSFIVKHVNLKIEKQGICIMENLAEKITARQGLALLWEIRRAYYKIGIYASDHKYPFHIIFSPFKKKNYCSTYPNSTI
jgi:hypothetical protein